MADLSQLPENDRHDFERRLAIYGLDADAVQPEMRAPRNALINLTHGREGGSFVQPTVIRVSDFASLNRMIGVDDRVFRETPQRATLPRPLEIRDADGRRRTFAVPATSRAIRPEDVEALRREELDSDQLESIRVAARAYLRGDSKLVSSYKPIFEKVLGVVDLPIWCFLTVRVAAGSTLAFGPGINVLVAHTVVIEPGGRIVSQGHLTVNCTILRQPQAFLAPYRVALADASISRSGE